MMVMMMLMLMIVTAALLVMIVVMVMLVVMIVAMALLAVLMMVMMMLMLMIVAVALLAVIVVVVMLVVVIVAAALLVMIVVMVMLVVMIVAMALLVMIVMRMVMLAMAMAMGLLCQTGHFGLQRIGALHGLQKLGTRQIVPRRGNDDDGGIMLAEEGDGGLDLGGGGGVGVGQDDTACVLHLIVEELAEVLHVHLALAGVHHGGKAVQHSPLGGGTLHGADDVGELTNARGLDENAVGGVLGQHLRQGLTEIAHKGAADTARVHFVDLNTGLGEESSVDADLTELVLDQHQLLARVGLGDELLDEGSLTGAQKAGENVDFGHDDSLLYTQIIFGWESETLHLVLYPFSG